MLNQIKIIGLTLTYLALVSLVEIVNVVYPHVDDIALSMRTSCG